MILTSNIIFDIIILSISFWLALYLYLTRNFNHWKLKKVPYIKPMPFFGNVFETILMKKNIGELLQVFHSQNCEPFTGIFLIDKPTLIIRDVNLIKNILIKDFNYFCDHSVISNEKYDPMGSYSLFVIKNPDWKELRRKLTPIFTSKKTKMFSILVEESTNDMVEYIKRSIQKHPTVDVKEMCQKFTTDVISSTAFGINANCFKDENSQFRRISKKMFDWDDLSTSLPIACYFFAPVLVPIFKMNLLNKYCTKFLKYEFCRIIENRKITKTFRNDLIDILIQIENDENVNDSIKLDEDKLVAQAVTFFAAGFETTSSTLTYALYELAHNEHIQNKLRNEINIASQKCEKIDYTTLKELPYLDMCIKETLRKYPVVPFIDRRCINDYKIPETDIVIDKGTSIFVSVMGLHYDENYYPDPHKFIPERFSAENLIGKPNELFLSFGQGPRTCIGANFGLMTLKISLALIIKQFIVEADGPHKNIKFNPKGTLLSPMCPIILKFIEM